MKLTSADTQSLLVKDETFGGISVQVAEVRCRFAYGTPGLQNSIEICVRGAAAREVHAAYRQAEAGGDFDTAPVAAVLAWLAKLGETLEPG